VEFAERPERIAESQPAHPLNRLAMRFWVGPGRDVDRALREGDEVAGFRVIDVPGHSPGRVVFWRESDRVLVIGDVLNSIDVLTGLRGLNEPKWFFTADPEENRRSARKLATLEPSLVLFGHGPPLRDTRRFVEFVNALP
jgi:hydroxyacylglutathione hydrolase